MTEQQQPKLAHELLADAVQLMLERPGQLDMGPDNMEQVAAELDRVAEHLRLSLANYRIAQAAFQGASFQGIVKGAIVKLDEGDTEAAKKFLLTLVNVIAWSPELPLEKVAPKPEPEVAAAWTPTHRSQEGIAFRYLDDGWMVDEVGLTSIACAFFTSVDGVHYATPMETWHKLFRLIEDPAA